MKGQAVGRAQLKPPTLQPRVDDRQAEGRIQNGDNSLSYPKDKLREEDIFPIDSAFGKFDMALEDAKRTLEKEKMLNIDDEEEANPDPDVFYALVDETKKSGRSKKNTKKKSDKKDLLVQAIKRALSENTMSDDDSYTQFSQDASSLYTGDELVNMASRSVSSTSFTSDTEASTLDETLLSGYSAADSREPMTERKHSSPGKDEETFDDAYTFDEETLISDCTEDTPMTNSISGFQSPFMCLTPKTQQNLSQRNHQIETVQSAVSEQPTLWEDLDYHDDDLSYDNNTFATRGTVGLVQDVLSCGTYRFCCGSGEKYRPFSKEDKTAIIVETTRSRKDHRVAPPTPQTPQANPLTVKERMNDTLLKNNLAEEAAEAKKRELIFQDEENAKAVAETLDSIFWKGDGLFSDELSSSSEKSEESNDLLDNVDPQVNPKPNEKALLVTSDASIASSTKKKPYLLSAARSFRKSLSFRRQKSSDVQKLPVEIDVNEGRSMENLPSVDPTTPKRSKCGAEANTLPEGPQVKAKSNEKALLVTSDASIASSSKKKPYLLSTVKSFGKSRKQKSSDVRKLPVEIDVEKEQAPTTFPEGSPQVNPKSKEKTLLATSDASITSSTKKKPYLLSAVKSFGKSKPFRRQKKSSTEQLPVEIDVDESQAIENLPSSNHKVPEVANREAETDTVPAAAKDSQRGRSTSAQPTNQGYEMPRKKSFRQMRRSRSRSRKRSTKQTPVPEVPPSPRSGDRNVKESLKQPPAMAECPTSPARTVDLSFSNDSESTDPELSAITATKWKSAIDKVTGKTYYWNNMTKEVTWKAPAGFIELRHTSPLWKAAYDTTTGKTYYYNKKTKEVSWSKPNNIVES